MSIFHVELIYTLNCNNNGVSVLMDIRRETPLVLSPIFYGSLAMNKLLEDIAERSAGQIQNHSVCGRSDCVPPNLMRYTGSNILGELRLPGITVSNPQLSSI
ncbi:unnamed protein product [Ceratitis capitata]|uniref:(Mediterranean fruit fly) hypothetical protein n=1 Tax=Ceratitis capitata TaxID=7213 RepID=A0A811V6M7_CERCA|nr:unnamed protein product [Ceratitis capitata]